MAIDIVKLGNSIYFDHNSKHPVTGISMDYDQPPKFWVFRDAETTGVSAALAGANLTFRTGFQGHYYGNFGVTSGNGFTTGSYYNVIVSGRIGSYNNITGHIFTNAHTFYVESNDFDTLALAASDAYYAGIAVDRDPVSNKDEWTVMWYKNAVPISGYNTPTLRVVKRDGTDLFNVSMLSVGTGYMSVKYDATSAGNMIIDGESYIVHTTAIIDGIARTGGTIISRDNAVG